MVGGWVLAREAVRGVDRLAVERYGLPSVVLMENAALGLAARAGAMLDELGTGRVVILAGPGNNGGDGFALARHLVNAGREVLVFAAGDPGRYAGDAATNLGVIRQMGLAIERLDRSSGAEALEYAGVAQVLIVDALLGTGLREAARGVIGDVILQVNRLRQPGVSVLAVDVPSGLDCDTGAPAGGGPAVEADATVTFVAAQAGVPDPAVAAVDGRGDGGGDRGAAGAGGGAGGVRGRHPSGGAGAGRAWGGSDAAAELARAGGCSPGRAGRVGSLGPACGPGGARDAGADGAFPHPDPRAQRLPGDRAA